METALNQVEFGFPTIEEKIRERSFVLEFIDAVREHGPLIPREMIAEGIGVSRQRVHQLLQSRRMVELVIGGRHFVTAVSLDLFLTEERKIGVNIGVPGWRQGPMFVRGLMQKKGS
jgi:hypothetical protein